MTTPATGAITATDPSPSALPELEGREAASLVRVLLVLTAGASGVIGLLLYAACGSAEGGMTWFAWRVGDPATAVVLGAGFLGAVPMLLHAATRLLWQQLRIPVVAAFALLAGLLGVTLTHLGALRFDGQLIAMALSIAWLLGVGGLVLGTLFACGAQLLEPGLPLSRRAPLPRWALPPIAVLGSALLGLGLGLLVKPAFWGSLLPWRVDAVDARMLGAWGLALGVALLGALVEDDLDRLRSGLLGLTTIGLLGLIGLGWQHDRIDWSTWSAALTLLVLAGLAATGLTGLALERRARRTDRRER